MIYHLFGLIEKFPPCHGWHYIVCERILCLHQNIFKIHLLLSYVLVKYQPGRLYSVIENPGVTSTFQMAQDKYISNVYEYTLDVYHNSKAVSQLCYHYFLRISSHSKFRTAFCIIILFFFCQVVWDAPSV